MTSLSNTIYTYYLANFDKLPLDKQLHFATRLHLWRHDKACEDIMRRLRNDILPNGDVIDSLNNIGNGTLLPFRPGSENVLHIRQPYFERYPQLRRSAMVLYWANLLDTCYKTKARERLDEALDPTELVALRAALLADRAAVAILSTHAVNFLYLFNRYFLAEKTEPESAFFAEIAADSSLYDFSDTLQTQLRIYLLTHTLIAESLFYAQAIDVQKLPSYQRIVVQLETILEAVFSSVNLDNKLEFLICCRLVSHKSRLEEAIVAEAADSLSPNGSFLIDTHNTNKQSAYVSFDKSEHRSVLYIMATTPLRDSILIPQSDSR